MRIMWLSMEIHHKKEIAMINKIFKAALEKKDINYSLGYINSLYDFDVIIADEYVTLHRMVIDFYQSMMTEK